MPVNRKLRNLAVLVKAYEVEHQQITARHAAERDILRDIEAQMTSATRYQQQLEQDLRLSQRQGAVIDLMRVEQLAQLQSRQLAICEQYHRQQREQAANVEQLLQQMLEANRKWQKLNEKLSAAKKLQRRRIENKESQQLGELYIGKQWVDTRG